MEATERRRHRASLIRGSGNKYFRVASAAFFLVISVFACCGVTPASSSPQEDQEDYAGWFSQRNAPKHNVFSSSTPPPPPPGDPDSGSLKKCVLDDVIAIDEEKNIVLLRETLVVDGCLLSCGNKALHSTVSDGSIVAVKNGGHVEDCTVVLIKEKDLETDIIDIDRVDGIEDEILTSSTNAPTVWGTYFTTGDNTELATYYEAAVQYVPKPVSGFLCDQGDCTLQNVACDALGDDDEEEEESARSKKLLLRECVLVNSGAGDVRVSGGLVTAEKNPVSIYGIVVGGDADQDAGRSPVRNKAEARLLVDHVNIKNQPLDGILILGGVNTVRITDAIVWNNGNNGIGVNGGLGLEFFAILGGSVENNRMNGIKMFRNTEKERDGKLLSKLNTASEMVVADVLVKKNGADGLSVLRIDDVAIDGAVFDGNGLNGIDVQDADRISLQGVVSRNNVQNGFAAEAIDADVEIANSVFVSNGYDFENLYSKWKQAGVYLWLSKRATILNSAANGNGSDGFLVYDVSDVTMVDVDAMRNGDDGLEIREASATYGFDYTANSDYLVGAYYYPWHGKNFHNGGGYLREELKPPQLPTLGEYNDSDPKIINQHMEWFRKSNIGLLVTSWWGPDRIEDTNTLQVLMKHSHIGNLKIALHYETTGRIKEEAGDDMSVPLNDIRYMCKNYFNHPNYYKIDGRPVLVIYISRKLERLGTLESALLTMRSEASKQGHNIYLIGDAVFSKAPDVNDQEPFVSFRYFDAVTNYDVYGSGGSSKRTNPYAGTEAVDAYYAEQEKWRRLAQEENCRYIPPVSPGYNDRGVRLEKDHPPLSRRLTKSSEEGSLFKYQLEKALPLVDPALDNLILVNSFNEWHEDTQIEPVGDGDSPETATIPEEMTGGLEYVGYGELYLDILRTATNRPAAKNADSKTLYEHSDIDFANVRSCWNGNDGMTFYITDNDTSGDSTEMAFSPRERLVSCMNERFDFELHGGGDVDMLVYKNEEIVGDSCANGKSAVKCEFFGLLTKCRQDDCGHRDIVTTAGTVLDDHKIG
mmetsp:Transcript_16310/g.37406  ORF Transcript_16310/g.37406 Transcript_16310/m.37406 type:complete len:1039 (-) Transcript_16310:489-3605(-)